MPRDIYDLADMPHLQENGVWVDLETGLEIFPSRKKRPTVSHVTPAGKTKKAYSKEDGKLATGYKNRILKEGVSEDLIEEIRNLRMPILAAIAEKLNIGPFSNKAAAVAAIIDTKS